MKKKPKKLKKEDKIVVEIQIYIHQIPNYSVNPNPACPPITPWTSPTFTC